MKKILFAVFCLGVFAGYFYSLRTDVAGVGVALGAPVAARAEPAVKAKITGGGDAAGRKKAAVTAKNAGPKKPAGRKKRVSPLRDPGEAMGGEIYTGLPAQTGASQQKEK